MLQEAKIKGYINIIGYKVTVDELVNPGRYGFRIDHEHDKTHYFSSDEKTIVRDWMKAIMKATIGRDYTSASPSEYTPGLALIVFLQNLSFRRATSQRYLLWWLRP